MLKIKTYNQQGKELEPITLGRDIIDLPFNRDLIYQAVTTQLANSRQVIAQSKTRAMVAGSGKKPWRQKGTGRARSGSIRNPIWIGGGVIFGPCKQRNFTKKFPKKMRQLALKQALAERFRQKKALIIDKLDFKTIKTKAAVKFFQSLPDIKGRLLVVLEKSQAAVELSMHNLPYAKTILVRNLNILDVLSHQWLIIEKGAIKNIYPQVNLEANPALSGGLRRQSILRKSRAQSISQKSIKEKRGSK